MLEDIEPERRGQLSLRRLERMTDLLFAFSFLIVAFEIALMVERYPDAVDGWDYLLNDLDVYSSFLINLYIIGSFWMTHQKYFSHYGRTDATHTALELLFMGIIVSMPFSNYVLGLDQEAFTPMFLVSVEIILAGGALAAIWRYGTRDDRLTTPIKVTEDNQRRFLREALVLPVAATIAIGFALFHPLLWMAAFIGVPIAAQRLKLV